MLDEFQTMPNHFHGILNILESPESPPLNLSAIIGAFKSEVTSQYCKGVRTLGWRRYEGRFWQRGFWDRVIRNDIEYERIREYIRSNPIRWELDRLNPDSIGLDEVNRRLQKEKKGNS